MLVKLTYNQCVQEEEASTDYNNMEAWRAICRTESDGEHLREVLSQATEGKVIKTNISLDLAELLDRLDSIKSVSEKMRMYKNAVFIWIHQLLELSQELVKLKVSFGVVLFDA